MNAIINAARSGHPVSKGVMFVSGAKDYDVQPKPCKLCRRMIINAGITKVIVPLNKEKVIIYRAEKWISENKKDPFKELLEPGY
jgi:deoxycytidylate deaminase